MHELTKSKWTKKTRSTYQNDYGMVACNLHKRESANHAKVEVIAPENPEAANCEKC